MSKRTERRAAQRIARKIAFQARTTPTATPAPVDTPTAAVAEPAIDLMLANAQAFFATAPTECATPQIESQISEAQLAANRANAQLSTGPTTAEGRAKSALNSVKHALTGNTVLLPTDDVAEYNRVLNMHLAKLNPATEEEQTLVQSIVDSKWRIERIKRFETGILIKGHTEFANKFEDQPEFRRAQLIETETYLKYEKSFRNLQIQEGRLYRRIEKDQAELTKLQSARKRDERVAAEQAAQKSNRPNNAPPQPATANGFVFASPETTPAVQPNATPSLFIQTA